MLKKDNTLIFMVDMQEKLVNVTFAQNEVEVAEKLIKAAEILHIPVFISEQYPKGLGNTVEYLKRDFHQKIEKTAFSVLKEKNILDTIESYGKKQILLFGIEAHICVYQTAMDLLEKGFEVYLLKDACKSRKDKEFNAGIELMKQEGVKITCLEIVLFEFLETSKNPDFKAVQQLIK